jgi:hypothetical protein
MNPLRPLVEALADRIHASGDAQAVAAGLTVQRLPWGGRRIGHPHLAAYAEARRQRVLRDGLDLLDRLLLDPATVGALAATRDRMTQTQTPVRRQRVPART